MTPEAKTEEPGLFPWEDEKNNWDREAERFQRERGAMNDSGGISEAPW